MKLKLNLMKVSSIMFSSFCISSCALFTPVKTPIHHFVLSKTPNSVHRTIPHQTNLLVLVPETKTIYDTTQMAYSIQPYQIGYFSQNDWAETPAEMIQPLIVQTLQNTHYFKAVVAAPYLGNYAYVLRTEILELEQDFISTPAMVRLTLRFQLSNATDNQIFATKEISVAEPMAEATPYAGVVAANDAMAISLQQLTTFILSHIKS